MTVTMLAARLDRLAARLDHLADVWQANMRGDDDAPDLIEAVGYVLATDDPEPENPVGSVQARDALAAWDALDPERDRVQALMDDAGEGRGSYETADSASFDLWEKEADMGGYLADALRDLLASLTTLARDAASHAEDAPPASPSHDIAATLATITGTTYRPDFADWEQDDLAEWEKKHGPITWGEGTLGCGACGRGYGQ